MGLGKRRFIFADSWLARACLATAACVAIFVPQNFAVAASMDDVMAELTALKKEVAAIRKENSELRNTLLRRDSRQSVNAPTDRAPRVVQPILTTSQANPATAFAYAAKAPAAVTYNEHFYVSADGSYQSLNLPAYDLGFHAINGVGGDGVSLLTQKPRVSGEGFSVASGYVFRDGTFSPAWGSNARLELGVSHVRAHGVLDGSTGPFSVDSVLVLVNGTIHGVLSGGACGGPCNFPSHLDTDYSAWNGSLKAASDYPFGGFILSPSITVFGGRGRVVQDFWQNGPDYYAAHSSLTWLDWGAKAGLDAKLNLGRSIVFGLGGNVGLAGRDANLAANDISSFGAAGASSVGASANAVPFLANGEASLSYMPISTVSVRGFVGVNYDSRVPGISSPSFTTVTSTSPSGIKFSGESSWYTGGRVVINLGP